MVVVPPHPAAAAALTQGSGQAMDSELRRLRSQQYGREVRESLARWHEKKASRKQQAAVQQMALDVGQEVRPGGFALW